MTEPGPLRAAEAAVLVRATGLPITEAQLAMLVANYDAIRAQVERMYEVELDEDVLPGTGLDGWVL
jgi:hypothetical protein